MKKTRRWTRGAATWLLTLLMLVSMTGAVPGFATPIDGVQKSAKEIPLKDGAVSYRLLKDAPNSNALPRKVYFRDNDQSYNRYYEIALDRGTLYVRKRNSGGTWKVAPCPEALKGKIQAISMDADEIIAVDKDRWIYNCFNCTSDTLKWNWGTAWGKVGRQGDSYQVGNIQEGKWALSITNVDEDQTYTDLQGNVTPVSLAGCTQIVFVDPGNPTKLISNDPWLPRDHSYNFGTPYHCRFMVHAMSASASTVFIMNKYGDMYTRRKDYDLSGGDPAQFRYSWFSQDGKENASSYLQHRLDRNTSAISLPSPYWEKQPKIDGEITDRITIESTAPGNDNRRLKVEGRYQGKNGYFTKMLKEKQWSFVETGEPLKGNAVENPQEDTSARDLAPLNHMDYTGPLKNGAVLTVKNFAYEDSVQQAILKVGSVEVPATLFTEYGNLGRAVTQVLSERDYGLTDDPRRYVAALQLDESAMQVLKATPEGTRFLQDFMKDRSLRPLSLEATTDRLVLYPASDRNTRQITEAYSLLRVK